MNAKARQFRDDLAEIQEQAAGMLQFHLVRQCDALDLLAGSLAGSGEATALLEAIGHCMHEIGIAPKRRPALCGSCPRPLRQGNGVAFGVAWPDGEGPKRAIAFGLCPRCATEDKATASAERALRRVWPAARVVTLAGAGRA